MKQQHVFYEEKSKLRGHTPASEAALQICLSSPTDRLFFLRQESSESLRDKNPAFLEQPGGGQKLFTALLG